MKYELRTTNYQLNTSNKRQATCDDFAPFCAFLWLKNPRNQRNLRLINDLRVRKFTYEIINLFMQNEPKFPKSQMNITVYMKRDYDKMDTWSIRKNEPKTNPNEPKTNPNPKRPK
jgi:hypothetical protein